MENLTKTIIIKTQSNIEPKELRRTFFISDQHPDTLFCVVSDPFFFSNKQRKKYFSSLKTFSIVRIMCTAYERQPAESMISPIRLMLLLIKTIFLFITRYYKQELSYCQPHRSSETALGPDNSFHTILKNKFSINTCSSFRRVKNRRR